MTERELDNAVEQFNVFDVIPYFTEVIPLLLIWVKMNLLEGGRLVKLFPINIFKIGLYFRIVRVFIALIQDIILVTKKEQPGKLKDYLTDNLKNKF